MTENGEGTQKTPEELREDIEQTRQELGDTVEALAEKTDVKAQAKQRVDSIKDSALHKKDDFVSRANQDVAATDHFIDLEWADLAGTFPKKRYDFIAALEKAQAAHPGMTLTPEKVGMQPWQTEEVWERLKSSLRDWRKLNAA